jgi:hypothetical protein
VVTVDVTLTAVMGLAAAADPAAVPALLAAAMMGAAQPCKPLMLRILRSTMKI